METNRVYREYLLYITCATSLYNNVQQSERIQITQRIKTFYFTKTIDHSDETIDRTMFGHLFIKPPHYLRAQHFAALYLLHYPAIAAFILDNDASRPNLYHSRIKLTDPECPRLSNVRERIDQSRHDEITNCFEITSR